MFNNILFLAALKSYFLFFFILAINDADYNQPEKVNLKTIKKEKDVAGTSKNEKDAIPVPAGKRRAAVVAAAAAAAALDDEYSPTSKKSNTSKQATSSKKDPAKATTAAAAAKKEVASTSKKPVTEVKNIKKVKEEEKDDDYKGLEEMYYGVRDGIDINYESFPYTLSPDVDPATASDLATVVDCPICDITESFDSNEKLQTHLVSHITIDGKDHQFQCLFCLDKHGSEIVLSKHNQIMHPMETKAASSASYHCLICQQRFNSLYALQTHLQKMHNMLELPYCCQACGYRSSSHRDVVRHFYDDHKNQNFLQCPFCLDVSDEITGSLWKNLILIGYFCFIF